MIKLKTITLTTMDGDEKSYVISRVPAIPAREIVANYPVSAIPKLGDYKVNEEMMLKLMSYVSVISDNGTEIALSNRALIDNHVPDWETLAKLEMAMIEYNTSFFANGKSLDFFANIAAKAQSLISQTLTDLLAQSSKSSTPP